MSRSKVPRIVSLIYTQNPFYVISACLFVYGLKLLFRSGDSAVLFQRGAVGYMEPWGLMASFAGVTVLMAVTAILVVRLGKVWEDARSLVLIVLLMLLAISVSLDELLTLLSDRDNSRGHLYLTFLTGVSFAVGICELLIRCLRIRFDRWLRLPLYGFLLLFFLWPGLLLTEFTMFSRSVTRWLIVAFPVVAAVLTLCLIPAVRRGSVSVSKNGTPWGWPLFPWTPFVFIAVAVCFRAYFLTMSYDVVLARTHYWDTVFGLYQLVPFFMAVLVVLLEMGRVEKLAWLQNRVMLFAPMLLVPAYPWLVPWSRLPAYTRFTYAVVNEVASPVFLTLAGLALMYAWAWMKGVRHAELGFSSMVFLSSCVGPGSFGTRTWELEFVPWPLLLLALIQLVIGLRHRRSLNTAVALLLAVFVLHSGVTRVPGFEPWRSFLTLHLTLVVVVAVGSLFQDDFAQFLQELGPVALGAATLGGVTILNRGGISGPGIAGYFIGMTCVSFGLWKLCRSRGYFRMAIVHCCLGVVAGIWLAVHTFLRADLPAGAKHVAMAVLSFAIAVFITVLKSGLSRRIRMYWATKQRATRGGRLM